MQTFKRCAAALASLAGLTLCILQCIDGQIIAGLCYLACAFTFCYLLLYGTLTDILEPGYQTAAQLIGILGIIGVLWNHNGANNDLQGAYAAASMNFGLLTQYCTPVTPEIYQLHEQGLMACISQNPRDMSSMTTDIQKNLYLGPALSLVDGTANIANQKEPNLCAQAFKRAYRLCPHAFPSVSKNQRIALLQAAE